MYFNTKNPKQSNSQVKEVKNIPAGITIQQLIDNAKKRMGNENFSNYDAEKLNCQNFLINVLDGSDIGDKADGDFIFQDATKIFKELPEYAKVLGKASVKLGAIFNRLIYGEGQMGMNDDGSLMGYGECGKPMGECICSHQTGMGKEDCKSDEHYHPENKFAGKNGCMKNHLMSGGRGRINATGLIDSREATLTF